MAAEPTARPTEYFNGLFRQPRRGSDLQVYPWSEGEMGGDADRSGGERTNGAFHDGARGSTRSGTVEGSEATASSEVDQATESNGSDDVAAADPTVRYRWTCPVCGETGSGLTQPERGLAYSTNNLRSHIRTTGDEAHGPSNAYPESFDSELDEHVEVRTE